MASFAGGTQFLLLVLKRWWITARNAPPHIVFRRCLVYNSFLQGKAFILLCDLFSPHYDIVSEGHVLTSLGVRCILKLIRKSMSSENLPNDLENLRIVLFVYGRSLLARQ